MKNLIYIFILLFVALASTAQNTDKALNITEEGKFIYTLTEDGMEQAVTARTFYLEAIRINQLPTDLSYSEFLSLSVEELKDMLISPRFYQQSEELESYTAVVADRTNESLSKVAVNSRVSIPVEKQDKGINGDRSDLKWVIGLMTNRGTEYEAMPERGSGTYYNREAKPANNNLPYMVALITNAKQDIILPNTRKSNEIEEVQNWNAIAMNLLTNQYEFDSEDISNESLDMYELMQDLAKDEIKTLKSLVNNNDVEYTAFMNKLTELSYN